MLPPLLLLLLRLLVDDTVVVLFDGIVASVVLASCLGLLGIVQPVSRYEAGDDRLTRFCECSGKSPPDWPLSLSRTTLALALSLAELPPCQCGELNLM